jgi:hypothetical protein
MQQREAADAPVLSGADEPLRRRFGRPRAQPGARAAATLPQACTACGHTRSAFPAAGTGRRLSCAHSASAFCPLQAGASLQQSAAMTVTPAPAPQVYYFGLPPGWEPSHAGSDAAVGLMERLVHNGVEADGCAPAQLAKSVQSRPRRHWAQSLCACCCRARFQRSQPFTCHASSLSPCTHTAARMSSSPDGWKGAQPRLCRP